MLSTSDKVKGTLLKPLIKAGVSGIATRMVYGDRQVVVFGTPYSTLTFGAGLGLASEGVAQIINMWVLPKLEANNQARHYESVVISLGISAGSFAIIPRLISAQTPTSSEMLTMGGIGALTEMVSTYIYDNLPGQVSGGGPSISVY